MTRLDGYTQSDAERLVTEALEAEKGLTGGKFLFDIDADDGLGDKSTATETFSTDHPILKESDWDTYNAAMERAHDLLDQRGIPNEIDLTQHLRRRPQQPARLLLLGQQRLAF